MTKSVASRHADQMRWQDYGQCGDQPEWSAQTAGVLRAAWLALAPVRPTEEQLNNSWVAGLTLDEMKAWVHRLDAERSR